MANFSKETIRPGDYIDFITREEQYEYESETGYRFLVIKVHKTSVVIEPKTPAGMQYIFYGEITHCYTNNNICKNWRFTR